MQRKLHDATWQRHAEDIERSRTSLRTLRAMRELCVAKIKEYDEAIEQEQARERQLARDLAQELDGA
jgi:crotonobetainyl-CoA:carnitine CoA-transferase CaiB-like acyl-CoA transferase